ncbi:MAG: glycoside hydrolase family 3 N-terminal domain-containing protein [Flavobacteriaceae bacterium]
MKTFKNIAKWTLVVLLLLIVGVFLFFSIKIQGIKNDGRKKLVGPAPTLTNDGYTFRDLNKNGILDVYEDAREDIDVRVEDLLARMTVEEKASQMFHPFLFSGLESMGAMRLMAKLSPPEKYVGSRGISHFSTALAPEDAIDHTRWTNEIQKLAEQTRLGIPITFSADPKHSEKKGASFFMKGLSQWPDATGFAALRDSLLIYKFAQIAAREYRAIGLHTSLNPVADLSTEPRWGRIAGTFGEDVKISSMLTTAYIYGMQGDSLSPASVSTMTKHFPGAGPQKDGWDAHFKYGKEQTYPGDNFDHHLIPFRAAIKAGTAQMMPYYGIPVGQTSEDVGFAFNKEIITDLLLDSLQYKGIVCSDWEVLRDPDRPGADIMEPRDHGVEQLDVYKQTEKALQVGIDQFGGTDNPELIIKLVEDGRITKTRLDRSVRKLLRQKFELGLFDNPYVDEEEAIKQVARPEDVALGLETMIRSTVLLKNENNVLPLKDRSKVYIENMDKELASSYFEVVRKLDDADFAILRLQAPFEPKEGIAESMFHQGRLNYSKEELDEIMKIVKKKPTIIAVYLERPIVIPEISKEATAVLGHFSISDKALLELISGNGSPEGKLPFELPSSMKAVENQMEDMPYDSENPLYPFGFGLRYNN